MEQKLSIGRIVSGTISLIFIIVFFSGAFADASGWLRIFDFGNVLGTFGRMGNPASTAVYNQAGDPVTITTAANFVGAGGTGARQGFLFTISLLPTLLLALGCVKVVEHLGALDVAEMLLRPILRPLMGVPGIAGVAIIAGLQSTDAGASVTRQLKDNKSLNGRETLHLTHFQFSAGGTIANYFASGAALFPYLGGTSIMLPLGMIFVFKVVGSNLIRLWLIKFYKDEDEEGAAA